MTMMSAVWTKHLRAQQSDPQAFISLAEAIIDFG